MEEKTNEIKAIPELLDSLNIKGTIITTDAMEKQAAYNLNIIRKLSLNIRNRDFSVEQPACLTKQVINLEPLQISNNAFHTIIKGFNPLRII